MGYKNYADLKAENNYLTIFTLSEKQEQLFHLSKVPTINTLKKRKLGKKNIDEIEVFTFQALAN